MLVGVIREINEDKIKVKVLKHENNERGAYWVAAKYFEKIGHVKQFNRAEVIERIKKEGAHVLSEYDLSGADLIKQTVRFVAVEHKLLRWLDNESTRI